MPRVGLVHHLPGGLQAETLHECAFDLADIETRVEAVANVEEDAGAQDGGLAGQDVDLHFTRRRSVDEVEERAPVLILFPPRADQRRQGVLRTAAISWRTIVEYHLGVDP